MKKRIKSVYRKIISLINFCIYKARYFFTSDISSIEYEEALDALKKLNAISGSTAVIPYRRLMGETDLTIIIPAFNAEQWIYECLDSVLNQVTVYKYKVIVVDDGSSDKTAEIIDSFLPNNRLTVINQNNKGYSGARNTALKMVKSHYIMFVDADDRLTPGSVQLLLTVAFEKHADIVEGNGYKFSAEGVIGKIKKNNSFVWGAPWLKVISSKLFECIEFPEGYLYEDTIIRMLIVSMACKIITIPEDVYEYRIHEGSITQKHDANAKRIDSLWIMMLMDNDRKQLGLLNGYKQYLEVMHHIIMTYYRTILFQQDVKVQIFIVTRHFLLNNYKQYLNCKDQYYSLAKAFLCKDYGKYDIFCRYNRNLI